MLASRVPYLRRLARAGGIDVWRVDGHRLRDRLDVDFTNGHHHYTRRYVPVDEIWLDREPRGSGEWRFWALHQLVERERMAGGSPYEQALRAAGAAERAARRQALGASAEMEACEVFRTARRRRLGSVGGREAWLVDGRLVRDYACVDFTLGGHGFRYRFIPRREIWIDDAVRPAERKAILRHEAVEVALMARGLSYDDAHARASRVELAFRRGRLRAV